MGCLSRLAGALVLGLLIATGWLYRAPIMEVVRRETGHASAGGPAGRPGTQALTRARDKVDSLNGWGADSVVLSASEMASLVGAGLNPELRGHLDSLQVELGDGLLGVSARLETSRIPRDLLGPLTGALPTWERVGGRGPLIVLKPGHAEWRVAQLELRGLLLPEAVTQKLIEHAMNGSHNGALPVDLPAGVSDLRIRPTGVTLYRVR